MRRKSCLSGTHPLTCVRARRLRDWEDRTRRLGMEWSLNELGGISLLSLVVPFDNKTHKETNCVSHYTQS